MIRSNFPTSEEILAGHGFHKVETDIVNLWEKEQDGRLALISHADNQWSFQPCSSVMDMRPYLERGALIEMLESARKFLEEDTHL